MGIPRAPHWAPKGSLPPPDAISIPIPWLSQLADGGRRYPVWRLSRITGLEPEMGSTLVLVPVIPRAGGESFGKSGCPAGTGCLSLWVGAGSSALGAPELTVGTLFLFLSFSFVGAGWAVSLPCRQEVEDDYIKSWEDNQPGDEALDTTKDPCQKVKCSRHKVCVAQGYQRAMCISRKKLEHRIKPLGPKAHGGCKPCHAAPLAAVCGSDGHTYSSACKLEQQACLASKQLTVRCEGQCPCPTPHSPAGEAKQELCTGQDLADLGDRLRDWFQLLRENAKQNGTAGLPASPSSALERSVAAACKEAVGWMFARLDTSGDLFLEAAELAAINLDKYEVCIRAFFNSCDTSKDGRVSAPEWCFCFWREKPPCLRELEKIQIQEATKKKLGTFIPSCDEDGYYRRAQCEPGGGECWCVDQHGAELTGTRGHGSPDCDEATGFSGDFGSSVGWEDEEEKEPEEAGEEGEEEEGEAGEGDDGGYIW
ncbi:testican-2 isoform X1 [Melospiza melodia melodia]|uniref:testican-2 isoform X1 n=2 Tax=Melospiza melodia melodia TaxID=1914991 RepID=UPI002FD1235B